MLAKSPFGKVDFASREPAQTLAMENAKITCKRKTTKLARILFWETG